MCWCAFEDVGLSAGGKSDTSWLTTRPANYRRLEVHFHFFFAIVAGGVGVRPNIASMKL